MELIMYLNIKMNLVILLGLVEPQCCFNLVYTLFYLKKKKQQWMVFKKNCDCKIDKCDCNTAMWWL